MVVEFRVQRGENFRDLTVILYPAHSGIESPFQTQNDGIRMAVQAAALVLRGDFRQPVGGIQYEGFCNAAVHVSPVSAAFGGWIQTGIAKLSPDAAKRNRSTAQAVLRY
jgi:hypothetical protein